MAIVAVCQASASCFKMSYFSMGYIVVVNGK